VRSKEGVCLKPLKQTSLPCLYRVSRRGKGGSGDREALLKGNVGKKKCPSDVNEKESYEVFSYMRRVEGRGRNAKADCESRRTRNGTVIKGTGGDFWQKSTSWEGGGGLEVASQQKDRERGGQLQASDTGLGTRETVQRETLCDEKEGEKEIELSGGMEESKNDTRRRLSEGEETSRPKIGTKGLEGASVQHRGGIRVSEQWRLYIRNLKVRWGKAPTGNGTCNAAARVIKYP